MREFLASKVEYRVVADSVSEILWIRELLHSLGIDGTHATMLLSDSLSAIQLADYLVFHERTKRVGNDCHFIRDEIIQGTIATKHVSTKTHLVDILTLALGKKEFNVFLLKLGVYNLHTLS
ncbi:Retrovirus-related Pol polyprotein from transposon RE2 [Cardamine amara subsp. amara]|uniref:Retrovirus-related Pol polyprotein from transposon RE2 n=1 Tax=Cardamine amara subsp. amara TaxID=228776 RepID=A0ABD0Z172_CARAN